MSFTQENKTNVNICRGCEKRCKFGYTVQEFTTTSDGVLMHHEVIYPTLAGKPIKSYLNRFGKLCHTGSEIVDGKILPTMQVVNAQWRQVIQDAQMEQAYEIAKLCDHYKQNVLQTKPQTNDDMIQIRLYDYLDKICCNLGAPVSMGCALALLKRLRDIPRPENTCLDDYVQNRFQGFCAELTTYYPGRYSDYAKGVLSLIAPYRYTCKKCEMGENHSANMQTCAKNIMSGECRDDFIRQTVGVTLFPEHYANEKQR